jgi:hypothetical protein
MPTGGRKNGVRRREDDEEEAFAGPIQGPPRFSDEDLALRFAAAHASNLRFVAMWGKWLFYDGMERLGFAHKHGKTGAFYVGLLIRQDQPQQEGEQPILTTVTAGDG